MRCERYWSSRKFKKFSEVERTLFPTSEQKSEGQTSGKLFACERSGASDMSDGCGKFSCQKYFLSILSSQSQIFSSI